MFTKIVSIILSLPKILEYSKDILLIIMGLFGKAWDAFRKWNQKRYEEKAKKKLKEAIEHAQETGDTSGIDDVFRNP